MKRLIVSLLVCLIIFLILFVRIVKDNDMAASLTQGDIVFILPIEPNHGDIVVYT